MTSADGRPVGLPDVIAQAAAEAGELLAASDSALRTGYPGDRAGRQPVHTAYVPADAFHPDLAASWGRQAAQTLAGCAPTPAKFGAAMGLPDSLAAGVRERVLAKLVEEPVEDLRLDFEDGYRPRTTENTGAMPADAPEDTDARAAARHLAAAAAAGTAPPFTGIRCRSLEPATRLRAIRTLAIFLAELLARGPLPAGFVVTLPKVTSTAQVEAMSLLCARLEGAHGLATGRLTFEIQAETPQLILGPDGTATLTRCVHAAGSRLAGVHYGTYDYAASLGIAGEYQTLDHPVADHARAVMQVAVAGTGARLSDGSLNVVPTGSPEAVTAAWQLHARLVRRALERGFYQGWDLHPAQLASRYAATYGFFLGGLPGACTRLRSYAGVSVGSVLEEPATARALAGFLTRGLDCGALREPDIYTRCGLDRAALEALSAPHR
jgi:citrate lyase beta subunit